MSPNTGGQSGEQLGVHGDGVVGLDAQLLLPETGSWGSQHATQKQAVLKMEFKRFVNAFLLVPCQIVRQSRRVVYRLLAWNPWQHVFLRAVEALRQARHVSCWLRHAS